MNQLIISSPSIAELENRASQAEAQLKRLQEAVDDLDAESRKLDQAFKVEPSEDLFSKRAVVQQRLTNAKEALAEQEKVAAAARKEVRAAQQNTIATALAAREQAIRAQLEEATGLLSDAIETFDRGLAALADHHADRVDAQRQGVGLGRLSLTDILEDLQTRLDRFNGHGGYEEVHTRAHVHLACPGTKDASVEFHIRRPAGAVQVSLH